MKVVDNHLLSTLLHRSARANSEIPSPAAYEKNGDGRYERLREGRTDCS